MKLDEIGYWSEVKLEIIRKYAVAYSTIMSNQRFSKGHLYVDAFAGAGTHLRKGTGELVQGSPLNALYVNPPFTELHFIDLDGTKTKRLKQLTAGDSRATVHEGDCNDVLLQKVFPRCKYSDYRRGLVLLDPYGLTVRWQVLQLAGEMKSVEVFYNFMIMDANMNVFWRDARKVKPDQASRMDSVWGDDSWKSVAYQTMPGLFGDMNEKAANEDIAEAFRLRLQKVAKFDYVPTPMPMRNSKGAVVYYLYFASPNSTGARIVNEIFDKYRGQGVT